MLDAKQRPPKNLNSTNEWTLTPGLDRLRSQPAGGAPNQALVPACRVHDEQENGNLQAVSRKLFGSAKNGMRT